MKQGDAIAKMNAICDSLFYYIRLALALCAANGHRTFCCAALL
jgi:hypothetical protein